MSFICQLFILHKHIKIMTRRKQKYPEVRWNLFQPAVVHWNIMKFWGVQATDKVRVPEKEKFIDTKILHSRWPSVRFFVWWIFVISTPQLTLWFGDFGTNTKNLVFHFGGSFLCKKFLKGSDQRETRGVGEVANDRYWSRTMVIDVLFSFYSVAILE